LSLLNAFVHPGEAVVAVDTAAIALDGSTRQFSKILPIPHINAVLANRGQGMFLNFLFGSCLTAQSFDELLEVMTSENLTAMDRQLAADGFYKPGTEGQEMVAVGWSDKHVRMVGKAFVRLAGMLEFRVSEFENCISPWDQQAMGTIPRKIDALEKLAKAQVSWLRSLGPEVAGGGELLVCRITRTSLALTKKCAFHEERRAA